MSSNILGLVLNCREDDSVALLFSFQYLLYSCKMNYGLLNFQNYIQGLCWKT